MTFASDYMPPPAVCVVVWICSDCGISLLNAHRHLRKPRHGKTGDALSKLDLMVFVPIEKRDIIETNEMPKLRRRVDAFLREMLVEQSWGFVVPVLEVCGTPYERAQMVTDYLDALPRRAAACPF